MVRDLMRLGLDGSRRVTRLLQTKFEERDGIVSPDGRWLAYASNSTGRFEIYARPFPNAGAGQWQVSTGGGNQPLWAPSGKELFYFAPDGALLRVPVETSSASWNAGTPAKLLERAAPTAGAQILVVAAARRAHRSRRVPSETIPWTWRPTSTSSSLH